MSKTPRLLNYKSAGAYVDAMGCGRCHHTPTTTDGGQVVPIMRKVEDGPDQAVMYWRISKAADVKTEPGAIPQVGKLREVLARFKASGYRIVTPADPGIDGTLIGAMPGQADVFYFDVQWEYEEVGPGIRPRIVLLRGECDPVVGKPETAKAEV